MSLLSELKRRNVFRVGIAYLVGSWLLMQVGDVVFDFIDGPDWAGKLLLAFLALGFVPALVFAWAYELTPEGLKRESEVDRGESMTPVTGRKLDLITIVLVVAGVGFLLFDRFYLDGGSVRSEVAPEGVRAEFPSEIGSDPALEPGQVPPPPKATDAGPQPTASPPPPEKSIAVLPFVNMSADPEQEYFSDGLAETLLHMLAQVGELRVAARTSSFQFKGQTGDVADIARKLNVVHVLEGSVRRAGNTLRVTAQLIHADDGFHLWSGTYDRELENIFAIQDEIAGSVVDALKVTLLGTPARVFAGDSTQNLDAYEEYLKGRQQLTHFSHESLPLAEAHFRRAIELDPDYLLAHVALAESYVLMANTGMYSWAEMADRIGPLAERVLELDPQSGPGQILRGYVDFGVTRRASRSLAIFERAFESAPEDDFVVQHYASFLRWAGDSRRAAEIARRALVRDPMSPLMHLNLASAYNNLELYDQALFHSRQVQVLDPASPNGYGEMAESYYNTGRFVDAIRTMHQAIEVDPSDFELPADLAMNLLAIGAVAEAARELAKALEMAPQAPLPIAAQVAMSYRQHDHEAAGLRALEAIAAGVDQRRWAGPVMLLAVREHALRAGDPGLYLNHIPSGLNVDLSDGQMGRFDGFIKLISVPVLRADGQHDLVESIIASAPGRQRWEDRTDPDLLLAVARRSPDAAIDAIRWRLRHGVFREWWLFLDSVSLDFLDGDPRLARILADIEAEMAVQRQILLGAAG